MPVSVDLDGLDGLSRSERIAVLRRRISGAAGPAAASPAAPATSTAPVTSTATAPVLEPVPTAAQRPTRPVLPVPSALSELLPEGGLARGSVVAVSGAGSLLTGILASVTASGRHAAVIGMPRLGLLAAAEMGAQLHRLALVPDPGSDPVEVAAVLLDGIDLVVLGLGGSAVPPSRARAVVARARAKGATLVVTDGRWDGAELTLSARVDGYDGPGSGDRRGRGRVRAVRLGVEVQGRAIRPRTGRLVVASAGEGVEWSTVRESGPTMTALSS
ncbi:hypothetical protein [Rhodococcoides kroppenstedtii]|uniref:hypothetical protein n=1 Tax=Rhodococcoides kroppenstedtii TaxID=293050 RepID=UPI0028E89148|nr:hypothetical protein [Rhodococcus kroppenstedtii]